MITKSRQVEKSAHRDVKSAALVVSLALSAYLISVALASPKYRLLCWIGFLPLFAVVRSLRPLLAALAGGFWGACLYSFLTAGAVPEVAAVSTAIAPSGRLLVLYIVIPTVYVGLAARPAWAIGFKLVMLVLGWTPVESVLHLSNPSRQHDRLLTGPQDEGLHFHWLARFFGYMSAAFLVAGASASLVRVLNGARMSFPAHRSFAGSTATRTAVLSDVLLVIQSWTLGLAYPRAPPTRVDVSIWIRVDSADWSL